jgi:Rieske Fe-S protein
MDRRDFVRLCASSAAWVVSGQAFPASVVLEDRPPVQLLDRNDQPLRAEDVPLGEALVFNYPYRGVPCFLINVGERAAATGQLAAFVAICTHQMSYPQPEVSYLRYTRSGSDLAGGAARIVCCAHASVFDPAEGAKVVSGPAPGPLLAVRVRAGESGGLVADGVAGGDLIERYFKTYKRDLIARYGPGRYREPVAEPARCVPLSEYSQLVPAC